MQDYLIKSDIYEMNVKFNKDTKLIIGLGDSFCAGAGSESIDTFERCGWDMMKLRNDKDAIKESYINSFINVLSRKYLTDYIPLNLAMAGKGNRFAIRELYTNPLIGLENAGEKIVLFVSSGLERLDFAYDIASMDNHTYTIWPYNQIPDEVGYGNITFRKESIYNDQLIVGEFIMDMYMLMDWCKLNNAKLLFMSGFSTMIDRVKLIKILINNRDINNTDKTDLKFIVKNAIELVNKIPWHKQVKFEGYDTMIDYMLYKQGREDLIGGHNFRSYQVEKHTMDDYISKCQHITKKGHELIADSVIKYIIDYDNLIEDDYEKFDSKEFLKKSVI